MAYYLPNWLHKKFGSDSDRKKELDDAKAVAQRIYDVKFWKLTSAATLALEKAKAELDKADAVEKTELPKLYPKISALDVRIMSDQSTINVNQSVGAHLTELRWAKTESTDISMTAELAQVRKDVAAAHGRGVCPRPSGKDGIGPILLRLSNPGRTRSRLPKKSGSWIPLRTTTSC